MFAKLRWRFMWVSTLVLLLVITVVVGGVYAIASSTVMYQTRVLMDLIVDNDGRLPSQSEFNANQEMFLGLNTESLHEVRYFTAKVTDGEIELIDVHIAGISDEDAVSKVEKVLEKRGDYGRLNSSSRRVLHYERQVDEEGSTWVILLDATSRYGLLRIIMTYMAALWMTVLVLYIVVMGKYSEKLIEPFIENDEKQKRFITNASHELKTPLAVISANTEMTEVMGGKSKWTESTRRQVARLQSLIEGLVVLTRLDEMKELDLTDVDFSAAARETAEPYRNVIEAAGQRFQSEIAPDLHVRADRRSLQQLMTILLDNAAKYCDEGGAVSVRLSPRARGKGARFAVTNTYAEGKSQDFDRFFERFYRQDESHNSTKSGFGIGLSMAREIAGRMKGKLKVSYAGDEITFAIEL